MLVVKEELSRDLQGKWVYVDDCVVPVCSTTGLLSISGVVVIGKFRARVCSCRLHFHKQCMQHVARSPKEVRRLLQTLL